MNAAFEKGTFGYDLNYLSGKDKVIVLKSSDEKSQLILSAKYQGKVFTSTVNGTNGKSLGFVNYKAFCTEGQDKHANLYGGENRLWIGSEGGRFSIFFEPGDKQIYDNWHTPAAFDTEEWKIKDQSSKMVSFEKEMSVTNYLGKRLNLIVDRNISLLTDAEISQELGIQLQNGINKIAYRTSNVVTNQNDFEWTAQTGTICVWILDMFNSSDSAFSIIPYRKGNEIQLGKIATTDYFGEIPADRIKNVNGLIYFKTDGKLRKKIGINAHRTNSLVGNYDPEMNRLTIVSFDVDKNKMYLNQEWNPDKDPLKGDVLNAYNDGPLEDGSQMGPFLEIESCSPAALLKPGEKLAHMHNVFHFVGTDEELSIISQRLFGVSVQEMKQVFH